MTLEDAKKIVTEAETLEYDVKLLEGYSGRGMFGEKTAAVVGDREEITDAAQSAGVKLVGVRWDSMGKVDLVAY